MRTTTVVGAISVSIQEDLDRPATARGIDTSDTVPPSARDFRRADRNNQPGLALVDTGSTVRMGQGAVLHWYVAAELGTLLYGAEQELRKCTDGRCRECIDEISIIGLITLFTV